MSADNRIDMLKCPENFKLDILTMDTDVSGFKNEYDRYDNYLQSKAKNLEKDGIAKTYLVRNLEDNKICGYFSIMTGTIKVKNIKNTLNKEINSPEESCSCIHIHCLAGDIDFCQKYKHLIKFMISILETIITKELNKYLNIKFITLDADTEIDDTLVNKYSNAGFKVVNYSFELPLMVKNIYE